MEAILTTTDIIFRIKELGNGLKAANSEFQMPKSSRIGIFPFYWVCLLCT